MYITSESRKVKLYSYHFRVNSIEHLFDFEDTFQATHVNRNFHILRTKMDQPGPSGLQNNNRNIFQVFENDNESGDEDFDINGLNVDNLDESSDELDEFDTDDDMDIVQNRPGTTEWSTVATPEPVDVINDHGFIVRNGPGTRNIPGKNIILY